MSLHLIARQRMLALLGALCAPVVLISNVSSAQTVTMGEFDGPFPTSAFNRIASSTATDTLVPGFANLKFNSTRLNGVASLNALIVGAYTDPTVNATRSGLYTRLSGGAISSLVDSTSATTGGESILTIVSAGEWIDGQVTFAANTTAGQKLYRRESDGKLTTLISAGDVIAGGTGESITGFIKASGDATGYAFSAHLSNSTDAMFQSTASSAASAITIADERSRFLVPEPVALVSYPEVAYRTGQGAFIPTALEADRPGGIIEPIGVMISQPGNPLRFPIYKFGAIIGSPEPDYRFLEFEKLRLFDHIGEKWVGFTGGYIDEENPATGERYMGVFTYDQNGGWKNWVNSDLPLPGLRADVQEFNGFGLSDYSFAAGAVDVNGGRYIYTEVGGVLNYVLSTYDTLDGKALSAIRWNQDNIEGYTLFFTAEFQDGTTGVYSVMLPEPTTAAATLGLAGLFSRRRRRASSCFRAASGVEMLESRKLLAGETVLPPVNASKSTDNENEVDITMNPANPLQIYTVSNSSGNGLRSSYSTDGGASFTASLVTSISGDATFCDARAVFDNFGNLWMVYLNTAGQMSLARSINGGQTFTKIQTWTGSWDNPSIAVGANNFIAIQATGGGGQSAVGLQATGLGTNNASVGPQLAFSGGGFGDILVANDGSILITAHTSTSGQGPTTLPIYRDPDGLGTGVGFSLSTSISTNVGGFDFIPAQNSRSIDAEPGFAVVPAGRPNANRVYMTYTDESTNENNDTNIMLRWSDNSGVTWSAPIKLNDDVGTRSQFLQSIAIDPTTGAVGVVWYDSRNDGGVSGSGSTNSVANDDAQIYGVFSMDGGTTWQPNIQISANVNNAATAASPTDYGDWTGAEFYGGTFVFGYTDNSTGLSPANTSRPKFDIAVSRVLINSTPVTGIAGNVFDDTNANGVYDGEAGLSGMTVYIDSNNNGSLNAGEPSAVTDGGGNYSFTSGIAPGTYSLRTIVPAGRRLTTPASGAISVTVVNNQITSNQRFGTTALAAVNGLVFDDVNANGIRDVGEPAIPNARVYIDANNNGSFDNTLFTQTNSTPVAISASGTPTVTSTIVASAGTGTVGNVTVRINITHTFDGDLVVTLISPAGTRIVLTQNFGSSSDNFTNTVFDDAAATPISSGTAPFTGTFRPVGSLASLNGQVGAGTWTLEVADTANADGGTLNNWTLNFGTTEVSTLSDANGIYSFPALAVGSYNVRQVLTPGYGFTNPSSGLQAVTAAAGTVYTRDFGSRDVNRPLQLSGAFLVDAAVPSVTVTFNEDVIINPSRVTLTNLTTSTVISSANLAVSFDSTTDTATITFPGFAGGILPDADWSLAVLATVTDTGGALIANPAAVNFFTLAGDANRDRTVNFDDLLIVAQNYNTAGKVFTQGNFNYSAGGAVDFDDLLILAQNYSKTLLTASPIGPAMKKTRGSVSSQIFAG